VYINNTYFGSRSYAHRVNVYESFEDGGPGFSIPHDQWGTSVYEKDGTSVTIGVQLDYGDAFQPPAKASYTYPVNDRTAYISGYVTGGFELFVSEGIDDDLSIRISQAVWTCDKIG
jgi:hypothetical protein